MGWALALRRREEPILLVAAGTVLAALALVPLVSLGGELAKGEALRHAARALSSPRTWVLFLTSLGLASAVTLLSLAVGLPLGVLLGRTDVPLRRVALWLHAFPLFVPPFLLALGWFHVLGRGGLAGSASGARIGTSVWNSLLDALLAATLVLGLAVVIGHAAARRRRGGVGLDALAVLAFVTPASVLGVGLVATWNRPSLQAVYGTSAIVGLAFAARYGAVGLRTAAVSFSQGSEHHEEAAAIAGARFLRRLGRILVPIHARGLAAAWLLAVVFCLRDLETAVLLYPAGQEPLTVRIFTLEANGPAAVVAALSCVQVAMTAAVLAAGSALLFRRRR